MIVIPTLLWLASGGMSMSVRSVCGLFHRRRIVFEYGAATGGDMRRSCRGPRKLNGIGYYYDTINIK